MTGSAPPLTAKWCRFHAPPGPSHLPGHRHTGEGGRLMAWRMAVSCKVHASASLTELGQRPRLCQLRGLLEQRHGHGGGCVRPRPPFSCPATARASQSRMQILRPSAATRGDEGQRGPSSTPCAVCQTKWLSTHFQFALDKTYPADPPTHLRLHAAADPSQQTTAALVTRCHRLRIACYSSRPRT
jgi:hypothetical protein